MGKSNTNNIGVYGKYIIQRTDGTEIDPNDEYFVLKVKGLGDPKHIEACRQALLTYSKEIQTHLPDLAHDIDMRYGDYPSMNSHSPDPVSEVDTPQAKDLEYKEGYRIETLQEGNWFVGTEEQYRKVLELENHDCFKRNEKNWIKAMILDNHCVFSDSGLYWQSVELKKTQLTPEEFIRRAENTFKNQK